MHDYVKNLAKVVRAAREEAHLSQAALAEQIGCDERTIPNIENDRKGGKKYQDRTVTGMDAAQTARAGNPPDQ